MTTVSCYLYRYVLLLDLKMANIIIKVGFFIAKSASFCIFPCVACVSDTFQNEVYCVVVCNGKKQVKTLVWLTQSRHIFLINILKSYSFLLRLHNNRDYTHMPLINNTNNAHKNIIFIWLSTIDVCRNTHETMLPPKFM